MHIKQTPNEYDSRCMLINVLYFITILYNLNNNYKYINFNGHIKLNVVIRVRKVISQVFLH